MVQFSVASGQIIDPSGNQFIARGINVFLNQVDAATILKTFPGINAVRLATTPGADPNAIDALVQGLTSKGVVVLIEDHSSSGGNPNTSSGQALTTEANWYAGLAGKYLNNPYVWFGTANEPDNTANLQAVPAQEAAIYNAIRGAGSTAMVLMEMRGGFTNDAAQKSASTYAGMKNVAWDTHYYGWVTNYSTDAATIAKGLQNQIANAQSVKSADGTMPVIIGEYGPSTTGSGSYDANGLQVVQAVDDSGYGTLAWAWSAGTDTLTSSSGLTDFGRKVAQHIAAGASAPVPAPASGATPPATVPTPPVVGSGADTLVLNLSEDAYLGDAQFTVSVDGTQLGAAQSVVALHSAGKTEAFTFKGNFGSGTHTVGVSFLNDAWGGSAALDRNLHIDSATFNGVKAQGATELGINGTTSFAVIGRASVPATDTLQLSLSEDAWQGDAQAVITVDGKAVGGIVTVTASHAQGKSQIVTLAGQWGPGAHDIGIQFINDAYGGTSATDRNLYVNGATLDGQASAAPAATLYSSGTTHAMTAASPLVLQLSEDAYLGDAQFTVTVDGKTLGAAQSVTASHAKGAMQNFAFGQAMAAGTHDVAVSFLNDAYGGTAATDRNLYVNAIDINGSAKAATTATLLSTSTQHFSVFV